MSVGRWGLFTLLLGGMAAGFAFAGAKRNPGCGCETPPSSERAATGEIPTHDPAMAREGGRYVLFATGVGIPMRTSRDLRSWSDARRVFETPPAWTVQAIPGFRDHLWAPDIRRFGGRWHLYYAVSTFGKNRSAIGHATNATLDPGDPRYRWRDEGPVVQSYPADDFNAIDPSVVLDAAGTPWLAFGSFWGGLRIVRLDREGRLARGAKTRAIAARPHEGPEQPGAIEAPCIVRHDGRFYLFASFDFCCRGVRSTYNVRVGRSSRVEGPYVDRAGQPMLEGGGTTILSGGARWKGPGGQSVLRDGEDDDLVYHAYDAEDDGRPKLRVARIAWGRDGWPSVPGPG